MNEANTPNTQPVFNGGWWSSLALWRSLTLTTLLALLLTATTALSWYEMTTAQVNSLTKRLQQSSQAAYVAVLHDGRHNPALLVTLDTQKKQLKLQRVGNYTEGDDRSLQLWALRAEGPPLSLGVLGPKKLERLATTPEALQNLRTLSVSLEPRGGVPSESGPTGQVLFSGAVIPNLP